VPFNRIHSELNIRFELVTEMIKFKYIKINEENDD
jgi:hypothetical protein